MIKRLLNRIFWTRKQQKIDLWWLEWRFVWYQIGQWYQIHTICKQEFKYI